MFVLSLIFCIMIIHKEQVDYRLPNGQMTKKLIISYVNKLGKVSFLQYPIPLSEMYEWKYSSKTQADPPFYEIDRTGQYVLDSDGNKIQHQWVSYDNKPVAKYPVKVLPDMRINELLCSFGTQVDEMFDMYVPDTWYMDIEVLVSDDGFPEADQALTPITTISMTQFPQTIIFAWKPLQDGDEEWIQQQIENYSEESCTDQTMKDITKGYKFEFRLFDNEHDMLQAWVDFCVDITSLTGWNTFNYDFLYIYNRCLKNNIDYNKLSPTHKTSGFKITPRSGGATINLQLPMHRAWGDMLLCFRTWSIMPNVENYTLDYISNRILSVKKVHHQWGFKEFYEKHFREYVFYNCIDTVLCEQMDKIQQITNIWYMLASILRINAYDAFSTIKPSETVIQNFIYKDYKVIPSNKKKIPEVQQDYAGAFVWPSRPQIARMVGGLDFASLYPSIIREFLISPETYIKNVDPGYKPKEDEIITASGALYKKDPNAIIPSILTYYFAERKKAKNDMKQADTELQYFEEILKKRQAAL